MKYFLVVAIPKNEPDRVITTFWGNPLVQKDGDIMENFGDNEPPTANSYENAQEGLRKANSFSGKDIFNYKIAELILEE